MSEKNVEEARGGTSIFVRLERAQSAGETRAIIGEIIKKCAGAKYDRFRRLLRNYIMCGLERGSWTDDLDKPMPLEDFDMIYDNYPEWATVDKENGLKEGLRKGKREGTQESRATIIGELLAAFKEKLSERFGKLPQSWVDNLAKVADPARIIDLTGAIYKVNSPEEFEARLMEMTR